MAISEDDIARVRAATDIVALITEQVALKRVGRRWVGLCPFHAEKTGSFYVNAEEGRYHCFGCRVSGDQITWVRETQRLDFVEALRQLAERSGIELTEDESERVQHRERRRLYEAIEGAVDWYHDQLMNSPDARVAREYLKTRGINGDVARRFRLGFAPDDWDRLVKALSLSPAQLEGTGLAFKNRLERYQDFLRARLVFPIFDSSGRAVALGGRIIPGLTDESRREGKYKNSPETPIYSKRRTLYALNWAKDDIIRSGEIIVCEGYTDVIAFFQVGLERAVATCGTALGEEHFRTLRNFAQRIVLAYDADGAGQSAAESVYQWERQYEVDVVVARLPAGQDPAELAREDPEALRRAVDEAIPFLEFRLERVLLGADLSSPTGRARGAEAALKVLREHPSDLVRDQYLVRVADRLGLDVETLRQMSRAPQSEASSGPAPRTSTRVNPPLQDLPRPGTEGLRLLLAEPALAGEYLTPELFVEPRQRLAARVLIEQGSVSRALDALRASEETETAEVLETLIVMDEPAELDRDAVLSQLVRSAVAHELRQMERELRLGEIEPGVAMAVMRDVKERVNELEGPLRGTATAELREWLVARRVT